MSTRVVLFRDWVWKEERPWSVCFAGVQKLDGKTGPDMMQSAAAFRVEAVSILVGSSRFRHNFAKAEFSRREIVWFADMARYRDRRVW